MREWESEQTLIPSSWFCDRHLGFAVAMSLRLAKLNREHIRLIGSTGGWLNLQELAVATGFDYDTVRESSALVRLWRFLGHASSQHPQHVIALFQLFLNFGNEFQVHLVGSYVPKFIHTDSACGVMGARRVFTQSRKPLLPHHFVPLVFSVGVQIVGEGIEDNVVVVCR